MMLLGQHPRTDLELPPFASWFDTDYADYSVDTTTAALLTPLLEGRTVEIFMGTWCGDSKREVPRMLKVLDACHVPSDHIRMIMVDYRDSVYKQSPGREEKGLTIHHVPDLLVLDQGKEQGRIVESPVVSLEKDLLSIAGGHPYEPHYHGVNWLSAQLNTYSDEVLESNFDHLVDTLRLRSEGPGELIGYSRILILAGQSADAVLTCRLNAALYPDKSYAFTYLGRAYVSAQDLPDARKAFQKALQLDPTDKLAKTWLAAHPN